MPIITFHRCSCFRNSFLPLVSRPMREGFLGSNLLALPAPPQHSPLLMGGGVSPVTQMRGGSPELAQLQPFPCLTSACPLWAVLQPALCSQVGFSGLHCPCRARAERASRSLAAAHPRHSFQLAVSVTELHLFLIWFQSWEGN